MNIKSLLREKELGKTHYIPTLHDFRIGLVYEEYYSDGLWRESKLTPDLYSSEFGYTVISEIARNLKRFKGKRPYYLVKYLCAEDLKSLGFLEQLGNELPEILTFIKNSIKIILNTNNKKVKLFTIKETKDSKDIKDQKVFEGKVLNKLELTEILKSLGFKKDPIRLEKFKNTIEDEFPLM